MASQSQEEATLIGVARKTKRVYDETSGRTVFMNPKNINSLGNTNLLGNTEGGSADSCGPSTTDGALDDGPSSKRHFLDTIPQITLSH